MNVIGGDSGSIDVGTTTVQTVVDKSLSSILLVSANPRRACLTIINTSKKDLYINYDNTATDEDIKIKKEESKDNPFRRIYKTDK